MASSSLDEVGPAFVSMAHEIVWASVATVGPDGRPRTRVLHPIWEWDGASLRGWIGTGPTSLKRSHIAATPEVSVSYWAPNQDTCQAECRAAWAFDDDTCTRVWQLFRTTPEPLGYDPAIIPSWDSPTSDSFAVLSLDPYRLRVFPGSLLLAREGTLLTWSED